VSGADVVLVTGVQMPAPDTESPLLVAALAERGLRAEIRAWREPHAWECASLVVCRTPWDYFDRAEQFLLWAESVAAVTRLENPAPLVRWNAHKSYLLALASAGVPIVPTVLVPRGAGTRERSAALSAGRDLVVKPAIGGGALGARRGRAHAPALGAHLGELTGDGDALVQPFMPSVSEQGETSLVFFGGEFSHAVRKLPAAGDFRVQEQYGGTVVAHVPNDAEQAVAEAALAAAPHRSAYARIDLVASPHGPLLMEAELIEPCLFLGCDERATRRFAAVLAARVN
jgi:glutathione synthase/RimK-type ligase-like ATP-grasp enzyme